MVVAHNNKLVGRVMSTRWAENVRKVGERRTGANPTPPL